MIHAIVCALILIGVFKFVDRNRVPGEFDPVLDWWMALVLVIAPSILIGFSNIGIAAAELPGYLILAFYPLYFLVPFLTLKLALGFTAKRASIYSIWVFVVAILIEFVFYFLIRNFFND